MNEKEEDRYTKGRELSFQKMGSQGQYEKRRKEELRGRRRGKSELED